MDRGMDLPEAVHYIERMLVEFMGLTDRVSGSNKWGCKAWKIPVERQRYVEAVLEERYRQNRENCSGCEYRLVIGEFRMILNDRKAPLILNLCGQVLEQIRAMHSLYKRKLLITEYKVECKVVDSTVKPYYYEYIYLYSGFTLA